MKFATLTLISMMLARALSGQEPAFLRKDLVVAQQFGPGATSGPTTVADFNGDGRPDVALCNLHGSTVLLNAGGANFNSPLRTSGRCGGVAGEFTGDGRVDLIAGNELFAGRGDGTFLPPRTIGPAGISPRVVTAGDFNSDRRLDLVFYTGPTGWTDEPVQTSIHVLLAAADGTFSPSWMLEQAPATLLGVAIVADFNRDGRADLAVPDGNRGVLVFLGKGDGTFEAARRTVTGEDTGYLLAADFNADGLPDLATTFSVALGKGDGSFATPVRHPAADLKNEFGIPSPLFVGAAADFNGDGHLDLAGVPFGPGPPARETWVLPGRGDGTLLAPVRYPVGAWAQPPVAADVDGDGRIDLVVNGAVSNAVSLLLSRPQAAPALRRAVSAASGTAILAPGSLATLFGSGLATATEQAQPPWPSSLAGISLEVRDSAGGARLAPLLYVAPGQLNFQIPTGTAAGEATLTVVNERGSVLAGSMQVSDAAPGLFFVGGMFSPLPRAAATATRVEPDGTQTFLPLIECREPGGCFAIPLPEPDARPVFVSLYGTGLGNATTARVACSSDGQPIEVLYAGPQATPGLDQINVRMPVGSRGLGTVVCTIDGIVTNSVWL
jgi:uncharacterized protein (TIGR03437 family)